MILTALLWTMLAAAPEVEKCVVMPVRVPDGATADLKDAASGVESALTAGLRRHAAFHVLSRAEITALVGKAAQQQLMGCDATACMAEIVDALGANLVATARLDRRDGLWNLQASLLDQRTAKVVQRAGVRARDTQALFASVEDIARQLASGSRVSAEDPELKTRLATDSGGMEALRAELPKDESPDLTTAWTNVVVARNAESDRMALAQGALLGAAGLILFAGAAVTFFANAAFTTSQYVTDEEAASPQRHFPLSPILGVFLLPLPAVALAGAALVAAAVLGVVDARNAGRIRVGKQGCCRDEARVRDAEEPGLGRKVAPYLAAAGAAAALAIPLPYMVASTVFAPLYYVGFRFDHSVYGPSLLLDATAFNTLLTVTSSAHLAALALTTVTFSGVLLVASLVLMQNRFSSLTDSE